MKPTEATKEKDTHTAAKIHVVAGEKKKRQGNPLQKKNHTKIQRRNILVIGRDKKPSFYAYLAAFSASFK